ncbi:MAG TPA: TIGR03621 family F420-dependent LLM class oxidoreductase [Kineosporiaceae bacterium]|nr:TIGR03621 family F420-dependent LLM class oxidoreductase [Kineosporiaceae bacterium]
MTMDDVAVNDAAVDSPAAVEGRALLFGVNLGREPSPAVPGAARAAEEAGFDLVTAADHLGAPSPFAMLATAAAVTTRVRLRTYVLDAGFWNPALLAREAATLDALSGGRLDLGLGAGHKRAEHVDAGLPFPPLAARVTGLEATLGEVRRRLADPGHRPVPVQQPVPLVIGGWGERTLAVAARHADVIALTGSVQVPGKPAGTLRLAGAAETAERLALLDRLLAAAGRPRPVLDALLQWVIVDRPPEQAAEELAASWEGVTAEQLLDSPFLLLAADAEQAAEELVRRSRWTGITSWATHTHSAGAFAEVLRQFR